MMELKNCKRMNDTEKCINQYINTLLNIEPEINKEQLTGGWDRKISRNKLSELKFKGAEKFQNEQKLI